MIRWWPRRRNATRDDGVPTSAVTGTTGATFDAAFLAALEPFALRVAEAQKGGRLADQRTSARGHGADFADFRAYVAGDDLRTIDWSLFRRLGKLFVRVFEERQDLPVYLLIDVSRSMFVETPPRIRAASQVALGLAAIALRQHDSVTLLPFSDSVSTALRNVGGKAGIGRFAHTLAGLRPGGATGLAAALRHVGASRVRRGLLVVISDFFDDDGVEETVVALCALRHRLLLVQMTRAADGDPSLAPDLVGDVTLDDGEHGDGAALTITPDLTAAYLRAYHALQRHLLDFAEGTTVGMMRIDADADVLSQMTGFFAAGRLPR